MKPDRLTEEFPICLIMKILLWNNFFNLKFFFQVSDSTVRPSLIEMDIKVKIPGLLPNIEDETTDNDVEISENKSRPEEATATDQIKTTTVTSNQVESFEIKLLNEIFYKLIFLEFWIWYDSCSFSCWYGHKSKNSWFIAKYWRWYKNRWDSNDNSGRVDHFKLLNEIVEKILFLEIWFWCNS